MKSEGARKELLDWLFGLENFGIKLGLDNMRLLLKALGNPQMDYETIHVAGTNGKGSTCALLASILSAEGYSTGLYTSPHFVEFEERIRIDGKQMSEVELLEAAEEVRKAATTVFDGVEKHLTFFEITTAIAFLYFSRMKVDYAVVEVGLGGRLDATNVVKPVLSLITHVALEHTAYLGNTLESIAFEKGGIIKPGVPVITSETNPEALGVMRGLADEKGAELLRADDLAEVSVERNGWGKLVVTVRGMAEHSMMNSALWGSYQIENIQLAVSAAERLQREGVYLGERSIREGIEKVRWSGRLQIADMQGEFVFDSAHNPDAMIALTSSIRAVTDESLLCVLGVLSDKNIAGMLTALSNVTKDAVCVAPKTSRARPAVELREHAERNGFHCTVAGSVGAGMELALSERRERKVLVTGSLRTLGEAMEWWHEKKGEKLWN